MGLNQGASDALLTSKHAGLSKAAFLSAGGNDVTQMAFPPPEQVTQNLGLQDSYSMHTPVTPSNSKTPCALLSALGLQSPERAEVGVSPRRSQTGYSLRGHEAADLQGLRSQV